MKTFIKSAVLATCLAVVLIITTGATQNSSKGESAGQAPEIGMDALSALQRVLHYSCGKYSKWCRFCKSYAAPRQSYGYGNGGYGDFFSDPFFEYFFGNPGGRRHQPRAQSAEPEERQIGLGSV